ncbi:MAG: NAD-dependent epimerase/dehydratase family protein [Burkholderiaceae bacterium]
MKKVVVTGASGFLGFALTQALVQQGVKVVCLCRTCPPALQALGIEWHAVDLANQPVASELLVGAEVIFHVAALTGLAGPAKRYWPTNVDGTTKVLAAAEAAGVTRLVYTSSPSAVFDAKPHQMADESLPYPPSHLSGYAASKAAAEQLVLNANSKQLRTVALRPHLIVGENDTQIIPFLIERARSGRLVKVGAGKNLVSLTYIDNAVHAHLDAAQALLERSECRGKTYFINQQTPVNLWDWVETLLQALGEPVPSRQLSSRSAYALATILEVIFGLLPDSVGDPPLNRFLVKQFSVDHYYDISAAKRDIGYSERVSIEEATHKIVQAFKARA